MTAHELQGVRFVLPEGWFVRQGNGNQVVVLAAPSNPSEVPFRPNVVVSCIDLASRTVESVRRESMDALQTSFTSFEYREHQVVTDAGAQVELDSFTYDQDGAVIWVDQYLRHAGDRGVMATASCAEVDRPAIGSVLDDVAWNIGLGKTEAVAGT